MPSILNCSTKCYIKTVTCHSVCPEFMTLDCKWYGSANLRTLTIQCEELMVENPIMFIDRKVARYRSMACRALRTSGGKRQMWLSPIKLIDLEFRPDSVEINGEAFVPY